jgi:cytochrome b561
MTLIEPLKQQPGSPSTKKHSASIRLWHWLNLIVISGSLITVLINSTILKSRQKAPMVLAEMKKSGPNVTLDQARAAVHVLSDKIWDVHVYFGYALIALFFFRLIAEFFQLADQTLIGQFKKASRLFKTPATKQNAQHDLVVKSIYLVFYLLLFTMVATGICLAFGDNLGISEPMQHSIQDVHGFCMYPILVFIAVHIAGVLLAEHKDGKGIVSDMINGG